MKIQKWSPSLELLPPPLVGPPKESKRIYGPVDMTQKYRKSALVVSQGSVPSASCVIMTECPCRADDAKSFFEDTSTVVGTVTHSVIIQIKWHNFHFYFNLFLLLPDGAAQAVEGCRMYSKSIQHHHLHSVCEV